MPTRPMKFTRYCLTLRISKLPRELWIHLARQYLNVVFLGIKDLLRSEIIVKLKSNLYVAPVNIILIFETVYVYVYVYVMCVC